MNRVRTMYSARGWRHYLFLGVLLFAGFVLLARIIFLGDIRRVFLQSAGKSAEKVETLPGIRGNIVDRNGEVLALSTPGYSISVNPSQTDFTDSEVVKIADTLGLDRRALDLSLSKSQKKSFLFISRKVSREKGMALQASGIKGLKYEPEYHRYYPAAETTSHVIGKTNIDGIGTEGLELSLDEELRGNPGEKIVLRDLRGGFIRDLEYKAIPEFGSDIRLTIDMNLQFIAYKELKSAIKSHRAKSGSLIMLDVGSGEILAMVNQPSYNPNEGVVDIASMRNRAVTDVYEPGSTIKPFAILAALEAEEYEADTIVDTSPGTFQVSGHQINDPRDYGKLSLPGIIKHSSNVGIAKIALELPKYSIYEILQRAGLGQRVDVHLPGERSGQLVNDKLDIGIERAALAYGYGLTVTPLQLASAYLRIASGGLARRVSLLRREQEYAQKPEQVYLENHTHSVMKMMELVASSEGTGRFAALENYRVAGKTGTAQILKKGRYESSSHNVWFVGIVPVSKPRLLIITVVNDPQAGMSGGGTVAAPIFARVARHSLRILGVEPDKKSLILSQQSEERLKQG